jgi:hypothetical protein
MKFPPRETITPTTPLRLEVAAQLGFPDGSMSVSALRRLAAAEKLDHERIAGKYYVTLAAIEEMRARCRVPAKAPESKEPVTAKKQPVTSEAEASRIAVGHMRMVIAEARESLSKKSQSGTVQKRRLIPRV